MLLRGYGIHVKATNKTKIDPGNFKQLTRTSGFEHESKVRMFNGGGVAVNIKDSIRCQLRNDIPDCDLELIWVEILPPKAKPYVPVAW